MNVLEVLSSEETKSFVTNAVDGNPITFMSNMIAIVNSDPKLQECTPKSIINVCLTAASLNLPMTQSLGYAYAIPFNKTATFMLGYKGFLQLAFRSGFYKKINVSDIRQGEVIITDIINEHYEFELIEDEQKRNASPVIGYYAFYELKNGFTKAIYWSVEKIKNHAKKYSPSFTKISSPWKSAFDSMCRKTMIKQLLPTWGVMNNEMQKAIELDEEPEVIIEHDEVCDE